jgi:hypothetical protein
MDELARDDPAHPVGGAHGHGGLVDHDLGRGHPPPDLGGHRVHVLEVAGAVVALRGAHGDEDHLGVLEPLAQVGGEMQAALLGVALDQVFQAGFKDVDLAALQDLHDLGVDVHAEDIVSHFGEAGSGNQSHVAGADDAHVHNSMLRVECLCP